MSDEDKKTIQDLKGEVAKLTDAMDRARVGDLTPPDWRIVIGDPDVDKGRIVHGRMAKIYFRGVEIPRCMDIDVSLPLDGVANIYLSMRAQTMEIVAYGEGLHVMAEVKETARGDVPYTTPEDHKERHLLRQKIKTGLESKDTPRLRGILAQLGEDPPPS